MYLSYTISLQTSDGGPILTDIESLWIDHAGKVERGLTGSINYVKTFSI